MYIGYGETAAFRISEGDVESEYKLPRGCRNEGVAEPFRGCPG